MILQFLRHEIMLIYHCLPCRPPCCWGDNGNLCYLQTSTPLYIYPLSIVTVLFPRVSLHHSGFALALEHVLRHTHPPPACISTQLNTIPNSIFRVFSAEIDKMLSTFAFLVRVVIIFNITLAMPVWRSQAQSTQNSTLPLHDAVQAVNAAVISASSQGQLQDTGVLDDIERLLDIIANHVERMRETTAGTRNGTTTDKHFRTSTATSNKNIKAPPPLLADILAAADDGASESNINITCKGISVCNPVTIFNEKGAHKIHFDKDFNFDNSKDKQTGKN